MFLFCLVFAMSLCPSVYMCFVVTCWERADLLALVCGVLLSTTHCADKLPRRGCKQTQIHTDSHWIIDFLRL